MCIRTRTSKPGTCFGFGSDRSVSTACHKSATPGTVLHDAISNGMTNRWPLHCGDDLQCQRTALAHRLARYPIQPCLLEYTSSELSAEDGRETGSEEESRRRRRSLPQESPHQPPRQYDAGYDRVTPTSIPIWHTQPRSAADHPVDAAPVGRPVTSPHVRRPAGRSGRLTPTNELAISPHRPGRRTGSPRPRPPPQTERISPHRPAQNTAAAAPPRPATHSADDDRNGTEVRAAPAR